MIFCDSIARFAGSIVVGGFDPGAYAPGFMLASAPRTHPVATAPGTDLIAPQAWISSFDRTKTGPLSSWLRFRIDVGAPANVNAGISNLAESKGYEHFQRWVVSVLKERVLQKHGKALAIYGAAHSR